MRDPVDLDDVTVLERLGRHHVIAHRPVESHADHVALADPAAVIPVDPADGVLRDGHEAKIGVTGCGGERDVERHPVQVRADGVGHHGRRLGEHLALAAHAFGQSRGVRVAAEAHRRLGACRLVGRAVHRFGDPNLVDPLTRPGEHHADHVGHAGMGAAAEDRGVACLTSISDAVEILRCLLAPGDPRRRGTHVHAGLEQPDQFVDVGPQRVVAARVGLGGQQRVDVVGGLDPGRFRPAGQLGGVDTDLVGAVCEHPDQFHVRAADDRVQRPAADIAGRPLDDPDRPVGGCGHG